MDTNAKNLIKKYMNYINIENISENKVLVFLFIFSLGLRLLYVNPGIFHADSIGLTRAVERTYETGHLYGMFNGRYGSVIVNLLTYIPYHLITGINSAEKSILFSDILFASFSVIMLFLFIKNIFKNKIIPLFTALLFSISPIFLSITTYGISHGIEIFFILTSFFLLSIFHEKNSIHYLALSSFSIAFSIIVRESAIIFVPLYFLFYLNPEIRENFISIKDEVIKFRTICTVIFPFLIVFGIGLYLYIYEIIYRNIFMTDRLAVSFMGFYSESLPIAFEDLFFNLTIIGVLLVIGGSLILIISYENKFHFIFLFLWALTFYYFGNLNAYWSRFLAIVSVPFFIFMSIGLDWLYKKNKVFSMVIFLILIVSLFQQIQPIIDYRHKFSGQKEYSLWVKEQVPPNSIIIASDDSGFISYYADLETRSPPEDLEDNKKLEIWVEQLNMTLKNNIPIYLIGSAFAYDDKAIFRHVLV